MRWRPISINRPKRAAKGTARKVSSLKDRRTARSAQRRIGGEATRERPKTAGLKLTRTRKLVAGKRLKLAGRRGA